MNSSAFTITCKVPGVSSWNPDGITRDVTAHDMVELCRVSQDFYDLIAGGPVEEVLNEYLKTKYPPEHFTENSEGKVLYQQDHELYCEVSGSW